MAHRACLGRAKTGSSTLYSARKFWALGAVLAVCGATAPVNSAHASDRDWDRASTIAVTGLTLIAIGVPVIENDDPGLYQAGGSILAAGVMAQGLKRVFPETRPDGSDRQSFPSGHTAQAFAAATTIYRRQGSSAGIPAFIVAGFVGTARIKAHKHYWYDVVAGAAIGTGAGIVITNMRPDQRIAMIPWGDSHGGGISIAAKF